VVAFVSAAASVGIALIALNEFTHVTDSAMWAMAVMILAPVVLGVGASYFIHRTAAASRTRAEPNESLQPSAAQEVYFREGRTVVGSRPLHSEMAPCVGESPMSTQSPKPSPEPGITPGMVVPVPHSTGRPHGEGTETHTPRVEAATIEKHDTSAGVEERANNLGCGLAFLIIGIGMLAQRLGWIPAGDWIWPAALIGLGVGYLYKALRK
jgi:hypothetical protein